MKLETISSEWHEFLKLSRAKVAFALVPMRSTQSEPLQAGWAFGRYPLRLSSLLVTKVSKSLPAIGFLTALEDPQHGFFGGYLVLSELGRPLEFHCSTPVLPNQAQRILYGKTLGGLRAERSDWANLAGQKPATSAAVLTDQRDMLGLTLLRDEIIICVESNDHADGPT